MELNLGELLKMIADDMEDDERERLKIKVAELDREGVKAFQKFKKDSRLIRDEIKLKKKALELEFKRRMDEEIDPLVEELETLHDKAWGDMYDRYDLHPENDYNVNLKEKAVYQYMD